jgi:branched-chain amino acid transport system ATP-binding protein
MLALLRGLMAKPRLLLLDEPSLGLAPKVMKEVFRLIRALRGRGMTILLVEQNVRQALATSDRGYVLESGRVILSGTADELLGDDLVARSYLGVKHETTPNEREVKQ